MRICCTMIVKNEGHVIGRCLESLLPLVDCVCICDTGSDDDTSEQVKKAMREFGRPRQPDGSIHHKPFALYHHDWVNFGANRTKAFRTAEKAFGLDALDWHLVIDADDVLDQRITVQDARFTLGCWVDPESGETVVTAEHAPGYNVGREFGRCAAADCWWLQVDYNGTVYHRPHLFRSDGLWEYRGPIHEAAYRKEGQPEPVKGYLPGVGIKVVGGGARSLVSQEAKFAADVTTLEAHLAEHPEDARSQFYLAQSLRDAGRIAEAIQAYLKRAYMRGWDQEKYYALLQAGRLKQLPGQDRCNIRDVFLSAFRLDPTRAEAPFELARYMTEAPDCIIGTMAEGAAWAEIAARSPEPSKGALFAEPQVWEWSKALAASLRFRWLP